MSGIAKSSISAGLALAAAALVAAPSAEPPPTPQASSADFTLTATSSAMSAAASMANVPVNLVDMLLSVPAWEVQAMGRLADAMVATGSWQVWGPTNVFGFDEQDPPKLAAIVDMLIPVQPFSSVLADQLNWWAKANLPMNAGCAAAPYACPDPGAMLRSMFTVPYSKLLDGYQFPAVINPFTGQETSWSGQYVKLDRGAATSSLGKYLTGPPVGVATVSAGEAAKTVARLSSSIRDGFNPFVQNSEWFDDKRTVFAPVFRALAPGVCPTCTPGDPYDNPWLKNYPARPAAGARRSVDTASAPTAVIAVETPPTTAAKRGAVPAGGPGAVPAIRPRAHSASSAKP